MQNNPRISILYDRFVRGQIGEEELQELFGLAAEPENEPAFLSLMDGSWEEMGDLGRGLDALKASSSEGNEAIGNRKQERVVVRKIGWKSYWAAAVMIGMLGIGTWWMVKTQRDTGVSAPTAAAAPTDISAPQRSLATITLAGGRQLVLDSTARGALAVQGSVQVVKDADGRLAYKLKKERPGELLYNTLTNPRGSPVVQLLLSDGSKVWLNAQSSIRYPVAFTGGERQVEITGEAYFEVAPDEARPFLVKKGTTTVEVLGTSFNVNAYNDEAALRVTLLTGKVRVAGAGGQLVLRPGEQAVVAGDIRQGGQVDLERVMAWKNGLFAFSHTDLQELMRELARWYNVDVRYEGKMSEETFTGRLDRSMTLDQVLHILTNHRIHYTIEANRRLVIHP